ncbi:MAG: hypothetical protein IJB19_04250, partial [Clostridia bacterium]|nr:hypothetical protein [Clostridia bacterium]
MRITFLSHERKFIVLPRSPQFFTCTPDNVPTLTLTVFRFDVCASLAVSSFEGASSAPFSYGTIFWIVVIAKSTAAYPVGR